MTKTYDRRAFLGRSGLTVAGVGLAAVAGGTLLEACGSSDSGGSSGGSGDGKDLGTLDYQLSWIKNVEFAGQYIADDQGFYKAAGFSFEWDVDGDGTFTPGADSVAVPAPVSGPAADSGMAGVEVPGTTGMLRAGCWVQAASRQAAVNRKVGGTLRMGLLANRRC